MVSKFIIRHVCQHHLLKRLLFSSLNCLRTPVKYNWPQMYEFIFGLSVLCCWCVYPMLLPQYLDYYSLVVNFEIRKHDSFNLVHFSRFATWNPLQFPCEFKEQLFHLCIKRPLIGTALNLQITLGGTNIFAIWSFQFMNFRCLSIYLSLL